jgi:hypothetical protein
MWRYIFLALLLATPVYASDDATKEMPNHSLLTDGAADDTVWVYDTSENSLKRMTAEEFITDYLGGFGSTNQVLLNDGVGGITWSDLVMGNVSGTGVTTIDTDSGSALSLLTGGANRIWVVGSGGVTVFGSGNTVTITSDAIRPSDLTEATNVDAYTGDTNFATHSSVTEALTARTDASAFTGVTDFITTSDGLTTTEVVYGGVSKWFVYSGTTLTGDMLAGGMLFCHASSPIVLGIPAFSGSTGYFGLWDMTGSGVTVQTTNGDTLYSEDDAGTAYFVNAGNSRHSASFTLNVESGSCSYVVVLGTVGNWWNVE